MKRVKAAIASASIMTFICVLYVLSWKVENNFGTSLGFMITTTLAGIEMWNIAEKIFNWFYAN